MKSLCSILSLCAAILAFIAAYFAQLMIVILNFGSLPYKYLFATWYSLLAYDPQDERQDNADDDHCRNGQVKTKPLALNHNIPRQASNTEFLQPRPH
jgi:hypothetical protein